MKKLLLVLVTLFCVASVASAKDNDVDLVQSEVETLKNMLPIEDTNVKLYDVSYTPKKGLSYFYILKNVATANRETVISNFNSIRDEAFAQLCVSLPEEFVKELVKTKTPIIYKYYDNSSKPITDVVYDLTKCPKQ